MSTHYQKDQKSWFIMLTVLVIVGALVVFLVTTGVFKTRNINHGAACKNTLRQLGIGVAGYLHTYKKWPGVNYDAPLPKNTNVFQYLYDGHIGSMQSFGFIDSADLLHCSAAPGKVTDLRNIQDKSSYLIRDMTYNSLNTKRFRMGQTPLIGDRAGNHDFQGVMMLKGDFSVDYLPNMQDGIKLKTTKDIYKWNGCPLIEAP